MYIYLHIHSEGMKGEQRSSLLIVLGFLLQGKLLEIIELPQREMEHVCVYMQEQCNLDQAWDRVV